MDLDVGTRLANGRYQVRERLGEGGMGEVYGAYDKELGHDVALKRLTDTDPERLYRFKREFRALSDISHPNLVTLYELHGEGDEWYLTMERVDGRTFLEFVRPGYRSPMLDDGSSTAVIPDDLNREADATAFAPLGDPGVLDEARLRACLPQLVSGLDALHRRGQIHRDVKPANILVTDEGHVFIVDFGVISEMTVRGVGEQQIMGTPMFIAPELLREGATPSAAADFYALGVVLYRALTGNSPYRGTGAGLLRSKQTREHEPIQSLPTSQADLAELAADLLERDPTKRPGAAEILRRLSAQTETEVPGPSAPDANAAVSARALVGRERELETMRAVLTRAASGRSVGVMVSGRSGMGKSAFVEQFLREAGSDPTVVTLTGRCYARESVPFKAFDDVVDALAHRLNALDEAELEAILPRETGALVRTFPVVGNVDAVAERAEVVRDDSPENLQRRAFAELRTLLLGLAERHTVVLFVDDLHWGDVDSVPFLAELLQPLNARLLTVVSFRREEAESNPTIRTLIQSAPDATEIEMEPLSARDVEKLAGALVGSTNLAKTIASESGGNPLFALELIRFAHTRGSTWQAASETSVDALILERTRHLSADGQALLRVIAVAGHRIPSEVATGAAGLGVAGLRTVHELRAEHFLRSSHDQRAETVEPYHDRVREAVSASLNPAEQRTIHSRLAEAFERTPHSSERIFKLADHYYRAESELAHARTFALNVEAAELAAATYAFEAAHTYMRQAARAADRGGFAPGADFMRRHGALAASAGRMSIANEAMLEALSLATDPHDIALLRMELSRVALGQLDTGSSHEHAAAGLRALGIGVPRGKIWGLLSGLVQFLWVRPRMRNFERAPAAKEESRTVTALLSNLGFAAYFELQPLLMIECMLKTMRHALRLGASRELAETGGLFASVSAVLGKRAWYEGASRWAAQVIEVTGDELASARVRLFAGIGQHFLGDTQDAQQIAIVVLEKRGHLLHNQDYLTGVADLAWNTMMRGYPEIGWKWIENGLRRAALSGGGASEGHTYRCYAGPALAALGRDDEGAAHLAHFNELLLRTPPDLWRQAQYLAHRTLFLYETDQLGEELDETLRRMHDMNLSPARLPQQIRHFYVAEAYAQIRRAERGHGDPAALRAALKCLRKAAKHPTLVAHHAIAAMAADRLSGDLRPNDPRMQTALEIATRTDNPWIEYEVAMERARRAVARADSEAAAREAGAARQLATERGWVHRGHAAARVSAQ